MHRSYLLDTQVILWMDQARARLDKRTWDLLESGGQCFYSAVSAWEVAIKRASGKLSMSAPLSHTATLFGLIALPVTVAHGEHAGHLPMHHRDPFDRLMVAQANLEKLVLVTADSTLQQYDIDLLLV